MSFDNPTSKASEQSTVDHSLGLFADAYSGKQSVKVSLEEHNKSEPTGIIQSIKDNPGVAAAAAAMAIGAIYLSKGRATESALTHVPLSGGLSLEQSAARILAAARHEGLTHIPFAKGATLEMKAADIVSGAGAGVRRDVLTHMKFEPGASTETKAADILFATRDKSTHVRFTPGATLDQRASSLLDAVKGDSRTHIRFSPAATEADKASAILKASKELH